MPDRLKIPPTKSALLGLRRQARFLEQGHDLLERKRELLTRLVYERLAQYRNLRSQVREAFERAYGWLAITQMRMTGRVLAQATLGLKPAVAIHIVPRSSVGVEYPAVSAEALALQPVGLLGTDASFDESRRNMQALALLLARMGEAETALWRLLEEQRKTQKRVNALKYNIIPRYQRTIRYIETNLEEQERNTLFQLKILNKKGSSPFSGA